LYSKSWIRELKERVAQKKGSVPSYIKVEGCEYDALQRIVKLRRGAEGRWDVHVTIMDEEGNVVVESVVAQSLEQWIHSPSKVETWYGDHLGHDVRCDIVDSSLIDESSDQRDRLTELISHLNTQQLPLKQLYLLTVAHRNHQHSQRITAEQTTEASSLSKACKRVVHDVKSRRMWKKKFKKVFSHVVRRGSKGSIGAASLAAVPIVAATGVVTATLLSPLWAAGALDGSQVKRAFTMSSTVLAAIPATAAGVAGGATGAALSLAVDAVHLTSQGLGRTIGHMTEGCKNGPLNTFGPTSTEVYKPAVSAELHAGGIAYGLGLGATKLACGVVEGIGGLALHPIKGAKEGGCLGLVCGGSRGLVGAVSLPVAGALSFVADVSIGMGNRVHRTAKLRACKGPTALCLP